MKTIAFIPVRGGSKSIPLKNIKLFCGKPLVCWNIEALENCSLVDEIVIATDSDEIECAVVAQSYKKTVIYRRLAENASDTATTESVMLEYIKLAKLNELDVFMLVQATSPLTGTLHFTEALSIYKQGKYDSMLTCVRNYRFFWNEDGTPLNYDYHKRPRRQNFSGMLMENGAFYINTIKNILEKGNRLSGNIGIYEMPEYTAFKFAEISNVLCCFVALVITFFSPEFIRLMTTDEFYSSWQPIVFITFGYVLNGLYFFFSKSLFFSYTKYVMIISLSTVLLNFVFNMILIPNYGYLGAGVAFLLSQFVSSVISLLLSMKLVPYLRYYWKKCIFFVSFFFYCVFQFFSFS